MRSPIPAGGADKGGKLPVLPLPLLPLLPVLSDDGRPLTLRPRLVSASNKGPNVVVVVDGATAAIAGAAGIAACWGSAAVATAMASAVDGIVIGAGSGKSRLY